LIYFVIFFDFADQFLLTDLRNEILTLKNHQRDHLNQLRNECESYRYFTLSVFTWTVGVAKITYSRDLPCFIVAVRISTNTEPFLVHRNGKRRRPIKTDLSSAAKNKKKMKTPNE